MGKGPARTVQPPRTKTTGRLPVSHQRPFCKALGCRLPACYLLKVRESCRPGILRRVGRRRESRVGRRQDGEEEGGIQREMGCAGGERRENRAPVARRPGGSRSEGTERASHPSWGHGGLERARGLLKTTVLVPGQRRVPGSWLQTLKEGEKGPRGREERLTQGRRLGAAHRPSQRGPECIFEATWVELGHLWEDWK